MTWHDPKGSLRLPFVVFLLCLAIAVSAAGCADVSGQALQQDIAQLRQDLNALTLAVHRGRGDTETVLGQLERRTREQAGQTAKQIADLTARLDALSAEVARVSARLDEISQRLDSLGRQAPAGGGPRGGGSSLSPAAPAPLQPTTGGPSAQESYQAAFQDFSKGLYPLAISGFREFLRRFPDSPLAESAQYWIGEAYFSVAHAGPTTGQADKTKEALEQSVQEYRKVIVNYPRGSKVPTALYKEALALLELKQTSLARSRLQYLLDHFPQAEEVPLAKERLAGLKQ
ncbi:MAG TPA: tetratricopeptide repeat protein [Methylomirabilota bacterium]|nr:tetratricopeptide repeat protein [Methylomirabilota bacterium]